MFKFAPQNQVYWQVNMPVRDLSGKPVTFAAQFLFELLTHDELVKLDKDTRKAVMKRSYSLGKDLSESADALDEMDQIDQKVTALVISKTKGWRDIVDEDEKELEFNTANLRALMSDALLHKAICEGFIDASRGAARKN